MQTETVQQSATFAADIFTPLEQVTRPTDTTEEVTFYLDSRPQTNRNCASCEPKGAIKPLRIVGLVCFAVILVLLSGDVK